MSKYRVFSGPHFPAFGLNTSYLSVFRPISGKYGPQNTPHLDTFRAVKTIYQFELIWGHSNRFQRQSLSLLACNSFKKKLQHRWFPVKFTEFLRTPFCTEQPQWLLLRFNSCFQTNPGQKPMWLSPIHTRFSWKRYLLPLKSRSSYCRCSVKEGLQLY